MALHEERPGKVIKRVLAGEGMLVATESFRFTDEYGRHVVIAGQTRVAPDHPLARRRPDLFRVAWPDDAEAAARHRGNLRARMAELRGAQAPQDTAGQKPDWYIG